MGSPWAISSTCQDSRETRLPPAQNCRPVTFLASSVHNQTTTGETFDGSKRSSVFSGMMSSVMRDQAAGARVFTVMPYLTPSSASVRVIPAMPALAAA